MRIILPVVIIMNICLKEIFAHEYSRENHSNVLASKEFTFLFTKKIIFFRLNFGLITVTMFVSMWISNTAAVAMMCPIMQAVLEELQSVC